MKITFAIALLLGVTGTMALGDTPDPRSDNPMVRRGNGLKDTWKKLNDGKKIDQGGTIRLTKSGIVSLGPSTANSAPRELAKENVQNAGDLVKRLTKLRNDKLGKGKKQRVRRGNAEGAICQANKDCDAAQPMCVIAENMAGPTICMKTDN
ncbi:hypothetical protein F4778DRAFT_784058 [Xylariomycetidae sp. FL2044]|nr:hypothetical protein F4778DRAFT_784058 [Xylariomycetidae sp. FL2044]